MIHFGNAILLVITAQVLVIMNALPVQVEILNHGKCIIECGINECKFEGNCISNYTHLGKQAGIWFNCADNNTYKIKGIDECNNTLPSEGYMLLID